jgi:hypothetical protein
LTLPVADYCIRGGEIARRFGGNETTVGTSPGEIYAMAPHGHVISPAKYGAPPDSAETLNIGSVRK